MNKRQILFSAPMVRALLTGTKAQTRRIVKVLTGEAHHPPYEPVLWISEDECVPINSPEAIARCPYGQPGDQLWVREQFQFYRPFAGDVTTIPIFYADIDHCGQCPAIIDGREIFVSPRGPWKPSIHMPRKVSRITLEITGVRVERVQDISEEDARAEGVLPTPLQRSFHTWGRCLYEKLWEQINGPNSWDANPWVWVIGFKRVMP